MGYSPGRVVGMTRSPKPAVRQIHWCANGVVPRALTPRKMSEPIISEASGSGLTIATAKKAREKFHYRKTRGITIWSRH